MFPRNQFIETAKEQGHTDTYIEHMLFYVDHLDHKGLPIILSLKHFSLILDIDYRTLKDLIRYRKLHYNTYEIRKNHGGKRQIMSPTGILKDVQTWIHINILSKIALAEGCTGYREGFSIKSNAIIHEGQAAILKMDLFRFFDTINEVRVYEMFKSFGYPPNFAVDLAKLTTVNMTEEYLNDILLDEEVPKEFKALKIARLPQGAPTSPLISNIIAKKLDIRLNLLARSKDLKYSRYADDITFSGELGRLPSINLLKRIVSDEGFFINNSKTAIRKKGQLQKVTGLIISDGVHIPQKYKKDIWRHLHFCKKFGVKSHLEKIKNTRSGFKDWLLGRIYYVYSIEKETGNEMLQAFNKIEWIL